MRWRGCSSPAAKRFRCRIPERRSLRSSPHRSSQLSAGGGLVMLGEDVGEIGTIAALAPVGDPPVSKYERLIARAKQLVPPNTIVAYPCEETALRGPLEAAEAGIIRPILVGPPAAIPPLPRPARGRPRLGLFRYRPQTWPRPHRWRNRRRGRTRDGGRESRFRKR